jgi:hypothetical protein
MARSAFKQIVYEAARQTGGRVADIVEPGVTPNFIAARIEIGSAHCPQRRLRSLDTVLRGRKPERRVRH